MTRNTRVCPSAPPARLVGEEVVGDVDRGREGVHGVVDLVLDRALLLGEGGLHLGQVVAARWLKIGIGLELVACLGV